MDQWDKVKSPEIDPHMYVLVTQLCPTLCDPQSLGDCSPLGASVHGILQARILEWFSIPFSRDFSDSGVKPRSPALQADSLPSEPPGKPISHVFVVNWFSSKGVKKIKWKKA